MIEVTPELLARHDRPGPRYTSYPTAVEFDQSVGPDDHAERLREAGSRSGPLSLYLHLPFCAERCSFCACHVVVTRRDSVAVARVAVADSATDADRPRLMGLLGAALGVGFVAGPVLGSVASLLRPSAPFLLAAAISVVNLVVAAVRIPETRGVRRVAPVRPTSVMSGPVLRFIVVTFTAITAFAAFEATFALLGEVRYGMTESIVALVFAGVGTVLVLTQAMLVGPVTGRLGEATAVRIGLGLDLVGFLLIASSRGWPTLLAGLAVLAVGQGLVAPSLSSMIAGMVPPDRSGAALGAQQSAGGLARVVGPLLGGALFAVGAGVPYLVAALLTLAVLPLLPSRTGRRATLGGA